MNAPLSPVLTAARAWQKCRADVMDTQSTVTLRQRFAALAEAEAVLDAALVELDAPTT